MQNAMEAACTRAATMADAPCVSVTMDTNLRRTTEPVKVNSPDRDLPQNIPPMQINPSGIFRLPSLERHLSADLFLVWS